MSLRLTRKPDQSWRDAAIEQGRRYGMEDDVTEYFDRFIAAGDSEQEAAFSACYEWDVLDFVPDAAPDATMTDPQPGTQDRNSGRSETQSGGSSNEEVRG